MRVLKDIRKPDGMQRYSMCDLAVTLLRQIKDCDGEIYGAVCDMIGILEEKKNV